MEFEKQVNLLDQFMSVEYPESIQRKIDEAVINAQNGFSKKLVDTVKLSHELSFIHVELHDHVQEVLRKKIALRIGRVEGHGGEFILNSSKAIDALSKNEKVSNKLNNLLNAMNSLIIQMENLGVVRVDA